MFSYSQHFSKYYFSLFSAIIIPLSAKLTKWDWRLKGYTVLKFYGCPIQREVVAINLLHFSVYQFDKLSTPNRLLDP